MTIGNVLKNSAIAGGVAAVINAVIFFISQSQGWISDEFPAIRPNGGSDVIGIVPVLISSFVPCIIGGLLYWLLTKYVPKGALIFWIIAIVFLFLSYFNTQNGIPNIPTSMLLALAVMHNVVASSLLYFLTANKENAFA